MFLAKVLHRDTGKSFSWFWKLFYSTRFQSLLIILGLVALIVWSAIFCIEEANPEISVCNESIVNESCNLTSLKSMRIFSLLYLTLFSLNASIWSGVWYIYWLAWPLSSTIFDLGRLFDCFNLKPPPVAPLSSLILFPARSIHHMALLPHVRRSEWCNIAFYGQTVHTRNKVWLVVCTWSQSMFYSLLDSWLTYLTGFAYREGSPL